MDATGQERTGRMEGRCLCDAVRIVVDGRHVAGVGACHCAMCRRWSGGVFMAFTASPETVTVTGEVARHASSDFAERAFCPVCGSHLWLRDTDTPGRDYELLPGLFAEAAGFPLISEVYADRAPVWARLAGDHRRRSAADYEAGNAFVAGDA